MASYGRPHAPHLSDEIILQIFSNALPTSWSRRYYDSIPPLRGADWARAEDTETLLALCSVSKQWHRIGVEQLYGIVYVVSLLQLAALVDTLEARDDLAALVKRVEVCCFNPEQGYSELQRAGLAKLLTRCVRLEGFAYSARSEPNFWGFKGEFPYTLPLAQVARLTALHLDFGPHLDLSRVIQTNVLPLLRQVADTLVCATLPLLERQIYDKDDTTDVPNPWRIWPHDAGDRKAYYDTQPPYPVLAFPRLVSLRLMLHCLSYFSSHHWRMPALRELSLVGDLKGHCESVTPLFRVHGGQILRLDVARCSVNDTGKLHPLIALCPALQHLAAPTPLFPLRERHPRLRSVNLVHPVTFGTTKTEEDFLVELKPRIPALELHGLRVIESGETDLYDLLSSPRLPSNADARPQPQFLLDTWLGALYDESLYAYDDDADPDYEFPGDLGNDGQGGASESEDEENGDWNAEDYDAEQDVDLGEWQATKEEALEMFREGLLLEYID